VAWWRGFPRKCAYCVSVLNKRSLNLFVFGSCFRTLAVILFQIYLFFHVERTKRGVWKEREQRETRIEEEQREAAAKRKNRDKQRNWKDKREHRHNVRNSPMVVVTAMEPTSRRPTCCSTTSGIWTHNDMSRTTDTTTSTARCLLLNTFCRHAATITVVVAASGVDDRNPPCRKMCTLFVMNSL